MGTISGMRITHVDHSLGAKRFTPAWIEASMRFFWTVLAGSS